MAVWGPGKGMPNRRRSATRASSERSRGAASGGGVVAHTAIRFGERRSSPIPSAFILALSVSDIRIRASSARSSAIFFKFLLLQSWLMVPAHSWMPSACHTPSSKRTSAQLRIFSSVGIVLLKDSAYRISAWSAASRPPKPPCTTVARDVTRWR